MSIVVKCPSCEKRLKAPDRLAGKRVRCKCGAAISVPARSVRSRPPESEPGLVDLSLLSQGENLDGPRCPGCGGAMAADAVVCVQCGFNRQTGERIHVAVDAAPVASDADAGQRGKKAKKPKRESDRPPSALPGTLVKLFIALLALGGFGWCVVQIVGAVTFDPTAQRDADLAKISPRMSVTKVVDAMGRPPKEILTERDQTKADNVVKFIPKKLFWSRDFMKKYSAEDLQYGFRFIYKYTEREQLVIWFDTSGKVISVDKHDPMGMLWG